MAFAAIHDDHRAVVEISHALPELLAVLDDMDNHLFSRQYHRFYGVGQFIDIQDGNALQFGDFVQIVIVGDNLPLENLAQFDQLLINLVDILEVAAVNLDVHAEFLLDTVEDIQAATAAIAFKKIG